MRGEWDRDVDKSSILQLRSFINSTRKKYFDIGRAPRSATRDRRYSIAVISNNVYRMRYGRYGRRRSAGWRGTLVSALQSVRTLEIRRH